MCVEVANGILVEDLEVDIDLLDSSTATGETLSFWREKSVSDITMAAFLLLCDFEGLKFKQNEQKLVNRVARNARYFALLCPFLIVKHTYRPTFLVKSTHILLTV